MLTLKRQRFPCAEGELSSAGGWCTCALKLTPDQQAKYVQIRKGKHGLNNENPSVDIPVHPTLLHERDARGNTPASYLPAFVRPTQPTSAYSHLQARLTDGAVKSFKRPPHLHLALQIDKTLGECVPIHQGVGILLRYQLSKKQVLPFVFTQRT